MRRLFTALLVAAALVIPLAADAAPLGADGKAAQDAMPVYRNADSGLEAQYPAGWKAVEGLMGAAVFFASPLESKEDKFSENVNIIVEDVSAHPGMTLGKYIERAKAKLAVFITEYSPKDSRDSILSGQPAKLIEYTGRQGVFNLHILQSVTLIDGKAYVVTFTAEEDNYERYLPAAKRIMDSLAIK